MAELGQGAMGTAYLALDEQLDRRVALKVLAPELARDERFRERFLRESRIAAALEHPNIVTIYAAGSFDGVLYLAMRYVEGGDLGDLVQRESPLPAGRVVAILAQIAEALDAAHARGLIHRDVKPGNILVDRRDRAYLADFGLAKHATTVASLSRDSAFSGTIDYMAPEQIEGGVIDGRCDVYSLGCVLYEALTAHPPYEADSDVAVVFAHLKDPPPSLARYRPDVSGALDQVIVHALEKDPGNRYLTCGALIEDATAVIGGGESVAAPPRAEHVRTFLIADVRGYTSYTQEHGDEAGGELAEGFAGVARRVITQHHGRLVELRGDEALGAFDSARQALKAAVELQAAVTAERLPRGVGIGLDAGEAVAIEGGYRGGPVNVAARLCALAGPGEILASEGVAHLARRVEGIRYLQGRLERLKGIDRPVRVVEIVPHQFGDALKQRLRRHVRGRRWPLISAAGLIAAAISIFGLVLSHSDGHGGPGKIPSRHDSVAGFDANTGRFLGGVDVGPGGGGPVVALGGSLWTLVDGSIVQIDPSQMRVTGHFGTGLDGPVIGAGYVWGLSQEAPALLQIEPRYGTTQTFRLPEGWGDPKALAVDEVHRVGWVALDGRIVRIDLRSGAVGRSFPGYVSGLLYAGGSLYAVNDDGSRTLKVDPNTGKILWQSQRLEGGIDGTVVSDGYLWATVGSAGTVTKLSPVAGQVIDTVHVGQAPQTVATGDGVIWVGNARSSSVTRIDTISDQPTTIRVGHSPAGMTEAGRVLWVDLTQSPADQLVGISGKVAHLGLQGDLGDVLDPAVATGRRAWEAEYAVEARLFNYADPAPSAGVAGTGLIPEIAESIPDVSGRTVTITIRRGFRFSPPSSRAVTASTMRWSIERALSPQLGDYQPAADVLTTIVGERAFRAGRTSHISGLTAREDTLTIRLLRSTPDLPAILALPYFSAVPDGTPAQHVNRQVPSAGPYYVASQNWYIVLKQNPYYGGDRRHDLDAIVYETKLSAPSLTRRTSNGSLDYVVKEVGNSFNPYPFDELNPDSPIARRYGPSSPEAKAGRQRYFLVPQPTIWFDVLNTRHGVFQHLRMRQAFRLALDREALAALDASVATDRLIPPSFTSTTPTHLPPTEMARARRLARPYTGKRVILIECPPDGCGAYTEIQATTLRSLGLHVVVHDSDNAYGRAAQTGAWDIQDSARDADGPLGTLDAAWVFHTQFGSDAQVPLPASWERRVERTIRASWSTRLSALMRLDRNLETRYVPVVPYAQPTFPAFVSRRLGCVHFSPMTGGLDLAALCLPAKTRARQDS